MKQLLQGLMEWSTKKVTSSTAGWQFCPQSDNEEFSANLFTNYSPLYQSSCLRMSTTIFPSHLSLVSTNIGLVIIVTKSILTHLLSDAKGLMQDIEEKLIRYLLPLLEYRFDPMSHLKKLHLA